MKTSLRDKLIILKINTIHKIGHPFFMIKWFYKHLLHYLKFNVIDRNKIPLTDITNVLEFEDASKVNDYFKNYHFKITDKSYKNGKFRFKDNIVNSAYFGYTRLKTILEDVEKYEEFKSIVNQDRENIVKNVNQFCVDNITELQFITNGDRYNSIILGCFIYSSLTVYNIFFNKR